MRIAIFEDNQAFRESLVLLLGMQPDMEVVGMFHNTIHVVEEVKKCGPDIVIMDIDLPGIPGYDAVRLIKKDFPKVEVIMFTVFDDSERIFLSLQNGASGYLLKNTSPEAMILALYDLQNGGSPITPAIARKVISYFSKQSIEPNDYNLSSREIQILQLLVQGNSYQSIGDSLSISIDTVRSHIRKVYEKLQVHSRTQAIHKAQSENLI